MGESDSSTLYYCDYTTLGRKMMRDPKRIPEVLSAIEKLWRTNPDLRLGQIIVNATKSAGRNVVSPEIYNIEDGDLLIGLDGLTPKSENENGA